MRRILASSFVVLSAVGNFALGQQSVTPVAVINQQGSVVSANDAGKPRVFVTDSNSWSVQSSAGGSNGTFGASSSGGAQPQTAEIIKTFAQRCPEVVVNNKANVSNYIVELDHEGGKGLLRHKDKIAVFVQKNGDSIFSASTLSVGGSVKDACAALLSHWAAHANELTTGYGTGGFGEDGFGGPTAPMTQSTSVTIDASSPNCDIEIDGNFVGNTPSTINLAAGKHAIVVKKANFQDWTRNMLVGSGSIHLNAEMVAK